MQQRKATKEGRPKSMLLTWFLSYSSKKEPQDSAKIEIGGIETDTSPLVPTSLNRCQVEIPDRRQSQLYTTHQNSGQELQTNVNKRRSFYASQYTGPESTLTVSSSSSSLSRSATWQPSNNHSNHNHHNHHNNSNNNDTNNPNYNNSHLQPADMIPARRTSRNYSEDPEIQAKLNAVLNSERTFHLTHILRENNPTRQIQTHSRMPI